MCAVYTAPEYSLELIRGIDLWKSYRFEEEGIESVQNLATADLRSLAIKTRYPIKTLADWMDQAILLHRLGEKAIKLWDHGIEGSAIELASRSPTNNAESEQSKADAGNIASALGLKTDKSNIEQLMNSLFWDETVRILWRVWQKKMSGLVAPTATTLVKELSARLGWKPSLILRQLWEESTPS